MVTMTVYARQQKRHSYKEQALVPCFMHRTWTGHLVHMVIYLFQFCSLKSPHPRPLPQRPKDCSIHLCLSCCLACRVIITIFLDSIYMC